MRFCDAVQARDAARVRALIPSAPADDRTAALGMALRGWEPGSSTELISALLDGGADPNATWAFKTPGRSTAYFLELAVDTNADVVKLLIQKGADIKGKPGCFALLKAADAGRDAAVRVLLDAGAPVTFEWRGETPLMVAVRNGHPEAAKLLKERGATR